MRKERGTLARGIAIASGMLVGVTAASALAADGTLKVEQGLQWFEGGGGTAFNGNVGGGEFGVYEWNLTNASLTLQPISATAKVNTIVNGNGPFTFQTFCLEPGVHIDFNQTLEFTVSTAVQLPGGGTANLDPRTAYLFSKFWNANAFNPAYVYSPLGASRGNSAKDLQLALWFTEGRSPYGGGPADAVDEYIADANAATAPGGSWTNLWGSTFPGNLGGVRALNIVHNGSLQQDLLALFTSDPPPPPPPPDGDCEGRTPGFWHNKNGLKLIKASGDGADWTWLETLNDLCLVKANGDDADFTVNKAGGDALSDYLVSGNNAVNMAQKLSQHVAAMQLNILNGFADEDCEVFTGESAECLDGEPDTITIGELMDLATDALCDDNYTPSGDPNRDYQACLKNILDAANNNSNWVH
jgi:hypothetical protein